MDQTINQLEETHQILPDYNLEMEYSNLFNDSDDELDIMAGFYGQKEEPKPPKKPLPKLKELRVRVKRLSPSVIQRYLAKKDSSKVRSSQTSEYRLIQRPAHKPYPQQLIVSKTQPQVRQIIKLARVPLSTATQLNSRQWHIKPQSLVGHKLGAIVNTKGTIPIKLLSGKVIKLGKLNAPVKRSLPNDINCDPVKRRLDTIEEGSSKVLTIMKNMPVVEDKSKSLKEEADDSYPEKHRSNDWPIKELQNKGPVFTNILNGKRLLACSSSTAKSDESPPRNATNTMKEDNKPMGIVKQSSVKIPLKTFHQLQLVRNETDSTKPNIKVIKEANINLNHFDRSKRNIIVLQNQNTSAKRLDNGAKDRNPHNKNLTDKLRKEENRTSLNAILAKSHSSDALMAKQPKIVKVPVSKLIKIPQGLKIFTNSEKKGCVSKPINKEKHIEKVDMSKIIMSSDMKSIKYIKTPESFKLTKQIKAPEVITISKPTNFTTNEVKNSSPVKIVKLPIKHSLPPTKIFSPNNTVTANSNKSEEMVRTKPVQSSKAASAIRKSNVKICGKFLSQSTQTEACQQTATKMGKKSANYCPSKNTQTKFTCNENICAIIDAGDFSINCFYCYDAFSIRKWPEFIRHMETAHHLKEHSLAAANKLLSPNYIIPNATKSKQVQVNTLKGRPIIAGKRKTASTLAIANEQKNFLPLYDADESQLENDLEMALNYLDDEEESDDCRVLAAQKFENSSPKNIIKLEDERRSPSQTYTLVEPKIEHNASEITFIPKTEAVDNSPPAGGHRTNNGASETIKFGNRTLGKNKIINLPSNIKVIGRLQKSGSNTENSTTVTGPKTSSDILTKNISSKVVVIDKLLKSVSTVSNESCKNDTSIDSVDAILEALTKQSNTNNQSNENKTDDDNDELATSCEVESFTIEKDISLDISQTNVEQNIKIEPHYDIDSGNENEHINPKPEENKRHRTYINYRKNNSRGHKSKPIPSNLLDSDDEMPSNDENEDEHPSPTNGCGILFGLTNRNIVIEFIKTLQKFPELWKISRGNDITVNYNESICKMREHINCKFNLEMTDFEVRLSVQRIKHWYCRTLQKLEIHNSDPNPKKLLFRLPFPSYFNLLGKFLTYDSNCTRDLILGKRFQRRDVNEMNRYPKWMLYKDPLPGDNKDHSTIPDEKYCLATDLKFSEDGESDRADEAESEVRSMKPFKSEQDISGTPPDPFICDICFEDFNSMIELVRHRLRHFSPQYPCTVCKRRHYSHHAAENCAHSVNQQPKSTDGTQFVCEICGVSYKSMGSLNCHKKDKHFNLRQKCPVCKFTSISNYRMVQHQKKRHVVEYGTCEQIAIKTRARTESKIPFDTEARREFEWRRDMRKLTKPGEHFFGCYKCKAIFNTRKEKIQHNRQEHPITECTVMCLLCKREKSLLSNIHSVRRHYTDVHKVPWDEIDDLVKNTKPLFQVLSPLEVNQLKSSENPCEFVTKLLLRKHKAGAQIASEKNCDFPRAMETTTENIEEAVNNSYDPFKFENNADNESIVNDFIMSNDEQSLDSELFQSNFYNNIVIDQDCNEVQEENSLYDDYEDNGFPNLHGYDASVQMQNYEYSDEVNEHYFIEEECMEDAEEYNSDGVPESRVLSDMENGVNEEEILEETVEYDFIEDVMDEDF